MDDCVAPPPLNDAQLLLILDGQADGAAQIHLDRCPFCRRRRDDLALTIGQLKSRLYRVECPGASELSRFLQNRLAADRFLWVQGHVADCPHCAGEVALLNRRVEAKEAPHDFLDDEGAPETFFDSLREAARIVVARLVDSPRAASGMILVRGEGSGPVVYEADGVNISIESHPDDQEPERRLVVGAMLGVEGGAWTVEFWTGGELAATAAVDELGLFMAGGLTPGRYGLNLRSPDAALEVRVPNVAV